MHDSLSKRESIAFSNQRTKRTVQAHMAYGSRLDALPLVVRSGKNLRNLLGLSCTRSMISLGRSSRENHRLRRLL